MSQIVDDLRRVAIEIKTETQVGGNTAARVGGAFERVADALEGTQQIEDMDAAVAAVQQAAQENEQTIQDIVNNLAVVQTTGQSTNAVMSQKAVTEAIDEIQENLTELGEKHPYISTIPSEADLAFSDTEGYDIVRFIDGGVQTKNFNSEDLNRDTSDCDFSISDENYYDIVKFSNGHIQTKNFNSATLPDFSLTNLSGKKIAFIGDSITAGSSASTASNRYLNVFCSLVGATFVNLGISGTGLCTNMKNNLSSQRFVTRATAANLNDVDMIVVFGGTNDFSYDSKPIGDFFVEETITGGTYIGTKKKVPPTDTDTFSGALHELINTIRGLKPETPILFMTPLNRGRYNSTRPISSEANANGDYLQDYVNAIKTICEFYAIPVFDSGSAMNSDWTSQVAGSITNPLTEDGLHPTDAGHIRLGKLLYKYVMSNFVI